MKDWYIKSVSDVASRSSRKKVFQRIILSLGFLALVALVGTLLYGMFSEESGSGTTNEVKSVLSSEELRDYSPEGGDFTVLMPGIPEIGQRTYEQNRLKVPIESYERSIENGSKVYLLEVHDYQGHSFDTKSLMDDRLKNRLVELGNTNLSSSIRSTYKGYPTLEAVFTVPSGDITTDGFVRYLVKDTKLYVIQLRGGNLETFTRFADSLRFN